jgi:Flp pilus assembly protein TadB
MDKNDLKSMWHDVRNSDMGNTYDKVNIEKSINMKHCNVISKIISDIKLRILVSVLVLIIYTGLMLYAFVYLDLVLSINSIIPLSLAGLFLLFITTSEIVRLLIWTKTADNMSVKESLLFIRKRLYRIRTVDFLSYLVILYLSAVLVVINYLSDIGGSRNLSWSNEPIPLPFLLFLIFVLLLMPWVIKYLHNQRYRKIYSELNNSVRILNEEA